MAARVGGPAGGAGPGAPSGLDDLPEAGAPRGREDPGLPADPPAVRHRRVGDPGVYPDAVRAAVGAAAGPGGPARLRPDRRPEPRRRETLDMADRRERDE